MMETEKIQGNCSRGWKQGQVASAQPGSTGKAGNRQGLEGVVGSPEISTHMGFSETGGGVNQCKTLPVRRAVGSRELLFSASL